MPSGDGVEYARDNQIPVVVYPRLKSLSDGVSTFDLTAILRKFEIDFILLAGFLKLIPVDLVQEYPKSIVNIHPSLLPAFGGKGFYGLKVHKAVIESGARYSDPTIHFVDENYDTGRTLAQRVVPVLADDSVEDLAARVLEQEHKLYVEVVSALYAMIELFGGKMESLLYAAKRIQRSFISQKVEEDVFRQTVFQII